MVNTVSRSIRSSSEGTSGSIGCWVFDETADMLAWSFRKVAKGLSLCREVLADFDGEAVHAAQEIVTDITDLAGHLDHRGLPEQFFEQ
ncbi:hypothetical protein Mkiyose1088_10450 [Mycobacterium kiyosense]|nr:hypothetical protein IWGMT90018_44440 [Mycobacterium kiyosense]BDE15542.1 hypothetical protein MKCMC460_44020 [Mycobacterium sp. 20KCMC460]GLB87205.1 hypothetical protein SRL2020130_00220 [Mycobacterium kiyosense]GLB93515.1 hypothetical protein SRL2020226_02910 [Mycobacterium kiyosense]GLC11419.1 hypothetical protein SRL2020448_00220 [Mycobacterium kiyosense]